MNEMNLRLWKRTVGVNRARSFGIGSVFNLEDQTGSVPPPHICHQIESAFRQLAAFMRKHHSDLPDEVLRFVPSDADPGTQAGPSQSTPSAALGTGAGISGVGQMAAGSSQHDFGSGMSGIAGVGQMGPMGGGFWYGAPWPGYGTGASPYGTAWPGFGSAVPPYGGGVTPTYGAALGFGSGLTVAVTTGGSTDPVRPPGPPEETDWFQKDEQ